MSETDINEPPGERLHGRALTEVGIPLLLCLIVTGVFFLFPKHLALGNQVLIAALFALSLDLVLGYAGMLSLGHAAPFGVGAYAAGLLAANGWNEPLSGLAIAGCAAAAFGFISSVLVVRGNDLNRILITLSLGFLAYEIANRASDVTGGSDGLSQIELQPLLGRFAFDLTGRTAYIYSACILLVAFVLLRRIVSSPFGLTLVGIRECRKRMPALGTDVNRRLAAAYTCGTALAGLAGALLAQTTQFVGLDVLSFGRSAEILVMLILGGVGGLWGGIVGATVFIVAHDVLSTLDPVYWQFWLGVVLMASVFLLPDGVVASLERLLQAVRRNPA